MCNLKFERNCVKYISASCIRQDPKFISAYENLRKYLLPNKQITMSEMHEEKFSETVGKLSRGIKGFST